MFFLKFLLIIFLAGLFIVLFFLFGVISLVSKARRQFKGQAGQTRSNTRQNNNGQPVTDTRDPEQARRKIIPDDEGEYVEYEEA